MLDVDSLRFIRMLLERLPASKQGSVKQKTQLQNATDLRLMVWGSDHASSWARY